MELNVLVEPTDGGFVARSGPPFDLTAEAATAERAIAAVRDQLDRRLAGGARVVPLVVPNPAEPNPWLRVAGMFKDDPTFDDFRKHVERYRDEIEADPSR